MSSTSSAPVELTPVMNPDADALGALESQLSDFSSEAKSAIGDCVLQVLGCMKRAQAVWQDYADNPIESDVEYTAVLRIGNERSRELHRIHLELREIAKHITAASGIRFRDTIGFSSQIDIVQAYAELDKDDSDSDRATAALTTIGDRIARLEGIEKQLR